jgi:hypothetical protein
MDLSILYSIDDFQFKTLFEYLTPNNKERVKDIQEVALKKLRHINHSHSEDEEETPDPGSLFKEFLSNSLISIDSFKPFYKDNDMKICDIFSYKNKVLVKISFRAIYQDVLFLKEQALIYKEKRERKLLLMGLDEEDDDDDDDDDEDDDDDNDEITRKELFESIKINARGNSEYNKNKIFAEIGDNWNKKIRGSFQNSLGDEYVLAD